MKFDEIFDELIESKKLNDVPIVSIVKVSTELLRILDEHGFLKFEVKNKW